MHIILKMQETLTTGSIFSIVDSRDIERLNKGDSIQLIDSAYNKKVYKVKLLFWLQ